jgi:hypothetical protein
VFLKSAATVFGPLPKLRSMAFVVAFARRLGMFYFIWLGCGRTHLFSAVSLLLLLMTGSRLSAAVFSLQLRNRARPHAPLKKSAMNALYQGTASSRADTPFIFFPSRPLAGGT